MEKIVNQNGEGIHVKLPLHLERICIAIAGGLIDALGQKPQPVESPGLKEWLHSTKETSCSASS